MLLRASELLSTLTIGRDVARRIDNDGTTPRLLRLRDDGRTVVEVGAMSEGTTDQLFLALRLRRSSSRLRPAYGSRFWLTTCSSTSMMSVRRRASE